ncbi:MAG: DNRLRE domain-containing protein, partial [Aeromicrobium sp.]
MLVVPLSRAGVRVPRLVVVLLVAFVSLLLTITMLPDDAFAGTKTIEPPKLATAAKPGEPTDAPSDSDGDGTFDRPDTVSAALTARLSKEPVEDLSARTESSSTIANPDGTFTQRQYASPIRLKDEAGDWQKVDYDLEKQDDGSYAPAVAPADVTVSGGGDSEAASVGFKGDQALAVTVPDKLPTPIVDGGIATYKLSATTDLLVVTTGGGVATRIRVNERPSADDAIYSLGLRADSLTVKESTPGALKVTDDAGKQVGSTAHLKAWDAQIDKAGDPINVVALDANLTQDSVSGDVTEQTLDLTTPQGFLTDPSTKYPVIIDPDINAVSFTRDTWIRSGDAAVNGDEYRLMVGSIHTHTNKNQAYSLLQWSNTQLAGKDVTSATMGLYQYDANSCDPKQMNVKALSGAFTESSTSWANQSGVLSSDIVGTSENRGGTLGPTCTSNGYITVNVTAMTKKWAQGSSAGGYDNFG